MNVKKPEMVVLNVSDTIVTSPVRKAVLSDLSWETKSYFRTSGGIKAKIIQDSMFVVNRKEPGTFYVPTGLVPFIKRRLLEKGIDVEISGDTNTKAKTKAVQETEIEGITLRKAQIEILQYIAGKSRGVIHAATGIGKSLVALGIFHQHKLRNPKCKILFLAHTIDLVVQAADQFKAHFSVGVWQGDKRIDGDIICATIQTAKKIGLNKIQKMFEVLVVDEAHRCADASKSYFAFIQDSFIRYRYGLTATLPNSKEGRLALEGCIGPVIASYDIAQGVEDGILSQPRVYLLTYPQPNPPKGTSYRYAYQSHIVENDVRNRKIVGLAMNLAKRGESSLIFVKELSHGNALSKILQFNKAEHFWIHGAHSSDDRKATKKVLERKDCLIGICSTIWNEGVSINSLNNCINAAGMKDSKTIIQIVGRGTRVDEGKTTVKIWDFLDRGDHISEHCFDRINTYVDNGWKISIPTRKKK